MDNPIQPPDAHCRVSDTVENELTYENDHPNIVALVEGTMVKGGITCAGCRQAERW